MPPHHQILCRRVCLCLSYIYTNHNIANFCKGITERPIMEVVSLKTKLTRESVCVCFFFFFFFFFLGGGGLSHSTTVQKFYAGLRKILIHCICSHFTVRLQLFFNQQISTYVNFLKTRRKTWCIYIISVKRWPQISVYYKC